MERVALTLKKYFIPHPGNDHKPHFLRPKTTAVILAGILFLEVAFLLNAFYIYPLSNYLASILPAVLVDETNTRRAEQDLAPLKTNHLLENAAKMKADDMATKGYFSHATPDGKTPWYFLDKAGYVFSAAGENLAVNFFDSKDVAEAWMNSAGHRANMLNSNYTEIGIATARGIYDGREAIFVVQFFGTPARPTLPSAPVKLTAIPEAEAKEIPRSVPGESFAAVINENAAEIPSTAPQARKPSVGDVLAAEPRTTVNYLYFALAGIVAAALVLKIFIKIRVQHPVLIANGILILIVIATAYLSNEFLSLTLMDIV
ncbi:MAG: SCP-like protein extracellular [Candidatus Giovannonibacteria bacterium GW2011_GWB1_45_9b]|uniref:SCP-like protein extracellular n=2 Tax=Candidatus Giovannoniibacteriota TaxID=1752738 RepID=A0A0G1QEK2_9BACT|nr:MAG: SCP-like protein extracellular [Candidatus Giovannonibacteria bacterium GW2011_GWC2_44_8]KKU16158.1 MAG: SCP-like protein extracellular [Candidatus Giovannonibacteria bacterium GW2011_GWB1_45_9b]